MGKVPARSGSPQQMRGAFPIALHTLAENHFYMFSKTTLLSLLAAAVPFTAAAHETDDTHPQAAYADLDYETPGISFKINSENHAIQQMQPTFKFGGYIMEKYSYSDRSGQATNGGFDTRFVRLYMDGKVYRDFYYKLQMEVNGQPGVDKGPRIVDAFVEWQKYDCFRVKLGQFKRSFGFENP